ncbi:MAG: M23 family metallopeptidase [Candidatus Amulumruptor caecigallinarius]|nr:M23 family metallopeptidase [Candidatus Amulumruptor caecigallinarius]
MYDNPGIDAEVASGASARAVFGGKVSGVYMLPGFSTVVIVNHGGYYTVYGNIAAAAVKQGDVVKQGQNLGRLAADENDSSHSLIHFEVWKNRDKLDPLQWIQ